MNNVSIFVMIILTFLCWWSSELWRLHQTKVFQTVPQPNIVSSESRCLDARRQTLPHWVEVGRTGNEYLWFSQWSLHHSITRLQNVVLRHRHVLFKNGVCARNYTSMSTLYSTSDVGQLSYKFKHGRWLGQILGSIIYIPCGGSMSIKYGSALNMSSCRTIAKL